MTYTAALPNLQGFAGGTVDFTDNGVPINGCGAQSMSGFNEATCTTSYVAPGSHSIVAVYSGDQNFNGSTSQSLIETVNPTSTATGLTSSANPSPNNAPVTYTATVNPAPDGGTVSFTDGGAAIAGCGSQPVNTATGVATCTAAGYPTASQHSIGAIYSGDLDFSGSTSPLLAQQINAPPTLQPTSLAFASQAVSTLSAPLQVTVSNTGQTDPLNVAAAFVTGATPDDFLITEDT